MSISTISFISISPLSAVLSFLKIFSTHSSGSTKLLLITNYHISIFPWTPKGFIFPESFLNFLLNLYIPPWFRKSFKFIVLSILQIHLWVKKLNLFSFTYAPKQDSPPGFYHHPPGRWKLPIPPEQNFLKVFFPEQKEGWEDYIVETVTKINKGKINPLTYHMPN